MAEVTVTVPDLEELARVAPQASLQLTAIIQARVIREQEEELAKMKAGSNGASSAEVPEAVPTDQEV